MNMSVGRLGAVNEHLSAYQRQVREAVPEQAGSGSDVVSRRTAQSFSWGPLTIRYEEESLDFNALAEAAQTQVDRIRRFNFSDALQTETERGAFLSAAAVAPEKTAGQGAATYGPDARMRYALQSSDGFATSPVSSDSGQESVSAPAASGMKAKQALKAYLTALNMSLGSSREGRLLQEEI